MGACDERRYPWLISEKRFIERAVREDKRVLGICLGAQRLAAALVADVYRNAHGEIGWFPVTLTDAAREPPIFASLPQQLPVFQ